MIAKDFRKLKTFSGVAACLAILFSVSLGRQAQAAPDAQPEIRPYALVIGVSNYRHWPAVGHALDNAREVARVLASGGFEIRLLENPSAAELKAALETLVYSEGLSVDRDVVVYYCGQSASRMLTDGIHMGWIIPRDCPQPDVDPENFRRRAVSTESIQAYAARMKSRRVIMFFDAALAADAFAVETPSLRIGGSHGMPSARQFIIAGNPGEPVAERNLFVDTLIQALHGQADAVHDGLLTGSELAVFIANRIARITGGRVNPQYGKSRNPKISRGDFVFHKIELPSESRLSVQTRPPDARIRILNIQPKFTQGISLTAGKYWIEVTAPGHVTQRRWISLAAGRDEQIGFDLAKVEQVTANSLGMSMKWIDGAEFFMGSPDDEPGRQPDERLHRVRLKDGFRIQTTEVSVGQFRQFVAATGFHTNAETNGGCWTVDINGRWRLSPATTWETAGPWMKNSGEDRDRLPVTCVSWNDAKAFARWLGKQESRMYDLPTEAQWELACRAGTQTPFAFGRCLEPQTANYAAAGPFYAQCPHQPEPGHPRLEPIGERSKNKWNLYDMHGNAAEWCRNWFGPYAELSGAAAAIGTERVVRGGHFASPADQCRSAKRFSFKPDAAANVIGFRLVSQPQP